MIEFKTYINLIVYLKFLMFFYIESEYEVRFALWVTVFVLKRQLGNFEKNSISQLMPDPSYFD